jgi:hypothetical protein
MTRELEAIQEGTLSRYSVSCMSDVNGVQKRVVTMLSEGINKYF